MTATETVSYGFVILAGLAVAAGAAWAVLKELIFEPREYTVFGLALEACRGDARVAVRLGSPLSGYGVESSSRAARQRIRHKIEHDASGVEHVLVQFQLRGPRGVGTVAAEGVRDADAPGGDRLAYVRLLDPSGVGRPITVLPSAPPLAAPAPSFGAAFPPPPPPPALGGAPQGGFAMAGADGGDASGAAQPVPRQKSLWASLTSR